MSEELSPRVLTLLDAIHAADQRVTKARVDLERAAADRADAMVALREMGYGYGGIAALLGISKTRVQQILRFRGVSHV